MNQPRKLLIVCHGAIGDVTRALPLASRIKKHWKDTEIHWGIEPISRSIVEHHPSIDKVHLFERKKGLSAFFDYINRLKAEEFSLVLDLQRHIKSGVTSWLTGAPRRIGFHRKNSRECNWLLATQQIAEVPHYSIKTHQYQKFGDLLGLPSEEKLDFGLSPSEDERIAVAKILEKQASSALQGEPLISLILGSTWESRFWRADYYSELITALYSKYGIRCVLVGGKQEHAFAEDVLAKCKVKESAINLVEKTSLRQLVAVFDASACAVGSDSGPMHIAAGVGIPVISLWGSTSPLRSAPYGSEHLVLQSPIGCSPCYRKRCPGLDTLCMTDIPVRAVLARLESVLLTSTSNEMVH